MATYRKCPRAECAGEPLLDLTTDDELSQGYRLWVCPRCKAESREAVPRRYSRELAELLATFEMPECTCVSLKPVCIVRGGCELYRNGHQCECPRYPPRCVHVESFARRAQMEMARKQMLHLVPPGQLFEDWWITQLWLSEREEYRDRDPAGEGVCMIGRESRVATMELRADSGLDLWHPDDKRYPGSRKKSKAEAAKRLASLLGVNKPVPESSHKKGA